MTVTDIAPIQVSSWNRQSYQRLKQTLSLGLRRQILMAVCDDLILRQRLVGRLQTELTHLQTASSKIISLNLNLTNPNPLAQIAQWSKQHPLLDPAAGIPTFQILGIECLTRQPASVQRSFLRCLQSIGSSLPRLECSLLLWVPRPWLNTIEQSVPEFWQWHTGIFEFEGEPTPVPPANAAIPESRQSTATTSGVVKDNVWQILTRDLAQFNQLPHDDEQKHHETDTPPLSPQDLGTHQPNPVKSIQPPPKPPDELISQVPPPKSDALPKLPSLAEIEQLQQQSYPPASLADAYLSVGNYYRDRIEQGEVTPENLTIAIQAYEQAAVWMEKAALPGISDALNDAGNLYWMLSRCPGNGEQALSHLERSIQAYQLALTKLTAETAPQTYSMIQNNLGAAYGDLARYRETPENLQQSIRAYEEALRYRAVESLDAHDLEARQKYASTQNNLGTAYWHLAQQQQPVEHLQQAIAAYQAALTQYHPEREPLNWGMIQNNLGTAYWNLAQYEDPLPYLQLAIHAYREALKYRRADVSPTACAATQNNLGTAYWHLATQSQEHSEVRQDYLQQCIGVYETAIAIAQQLRQSNPPIPVSFDVFATCNNLGLAYYQLATEPQFALSQPSKSTHLEAALHNHLQALQGFSNQPEAYQTALSYVIKTIRAFYKEQGLQGQNLALSKVPGQLLPTILPRL